MTSFESIRRDFMGSLFDFCNRKWNSSDFTEDELFEALSGKMGRPIAGAILSDLISSGLLRQTRYEPMAFEVTPQFLREMEPKDARAEEVDAAPSYKSFKEFLLLAMAKEDFENGGGYRDLGEVASRHSLAFSQGWVRKAANDFLASGYISEAFTIGGGIDGGLNAELTGAGLEAAEVLAEAQGLSPRKRGSPSGPDKGVVTLPLYGKIGEPAVNIPASNRTVTIKHNQPEYLEAVTALDKVIDEFRNEHRLDNELGHEKGALLKALEGGRELLNDTVLNVRVGLLLIVEPLRRLVEKYDQALVGAVASAAIPLFLKLLGIAG